MLIGGLFLITGCETEEPVGVKSEHTEALNTPDFASMTLEELSEYFLDMDRSQMKPMYTKTWIDTLTAEEASRHRNMISVRGSYNCGVVVKLRIYAPADSADVTVYEAGTTNVYRATERLGDGESFWMEINGDDYYDFVVEKPGDPTGSIQVYFEVDPDWGGPSTTLFSGNGPHIFYDYNFACPEPTDGTCNAYISVYKQSGTASSYNVIAITDQMEIIPINGISGNPSDDVPFLCNEDRTYDFYIYALNGSSNETFNVGIIRPDDVMHGYSFRNVDMTNNTVIPVTTGFDYFECPY